MKYFYLIIIVMCSWPSALMMAQSDGWSAELSGLMSPRLYVQKRTSSYDRTGGNDDFRKIAPGKTLTLLDDSGPGIVTHIWMTIASSEKYHLKKLVLRMYWDDEASPSVEAPIGDFFGLGLGDYFLFESTPLSVCRSVLFQHRLSGLETRSSCRHDVLSRTIPASNSSKRLDKSVGVKRLTSSQCEEKY